MHLAYMIIKSGFTELLRLEATSSGHLVEPLLKQGHLAQAAQDHIQAGFDA